MGLHTESPVKVEEHPAPLIVSVRRGKVPDIGQIGIAVVSAAYVPVEQAVQINPACQIIIVLVLVQIIGFGK